MLPDETGDCHGNDEGQQGGACSPYPLANIAPHLIEEAVMVGVGPRGSGVATSRAAEASSQFSVWQPFPLIYHVANMTAVMCLLRLLDPVAERTRPEVASADRAFEDVFGSLPSSNAIRPSGASRRRSENLCEAVSRPVPVWWRSPVLCLGLLQVRDLQPYGRSTGPIRREIP